MAQTESPTRKKLPYYPYYTKLFAESEKVLAMNLAEFGLYQFALNHAWDFGSIPSDLHELARVLRQPYPAVNKAWPKVSLCWTQNGHAGRLVNERQEIERTKAIEKSQKATKAVRTRYDSPTSVGTDETTDAHIRASKVSTLSSESEKEKKDALKPNGVLDDFAEFWEACETVELPFCGTDMREARIEWIRLDFEQKIAAVKGLHLRKQCGEFADPGYRPHPQNYLSKHTWERPLRQKETKQSKIEAKWAGI